MFDFSSQLSSTRFSKTCFYNTEWYVPLGSTPIYNVTWGFTAAIEAYFKVISVLLLLREKFCNFILLPSVFLYLFIVLFWNPVYSVFKRYSVESAVDKFIIAGEKIYLALSRENMHYNLFSFSVVFLFFIDLVAAQWQSSAAGNLLRLRFFRMKVNEVLVFSLSHQFKKLILALLPNSFS